VKSNGSLDLPNWLPQEVATAACYLLEFEDNYRHKQEFQRILSNVRLREFWRGCEAAYKKSQHGSGDLHGFYKELILILVSKGGVLRNENLKTIKKRRLRVADSIHKLCDQMQQDAALKRYLVVSPPFGVRLVDVLAELQGKCERFESLGVLDDTEPDPNQPQAGRKDKEDNNDKKDKKCTLSPLQFRRRIFMENRMAELFTIYTGSPKYALVAPAIEVAIDSPEIIDPLDVANRRRHR
jgi:hypothetical protein